MQGMKFWPYLWLEDILLYPSMRYLISIYSGLAVIIKIILLLLLKESP